ncbi:MAG: hypothetical protein FWC95_01765 [Defluviitaleaceae bacterium]|nr:hypothetical protein [Defluviitaleaceae bacterium]
MRFSNDPIDVIQIIQLFIPVLTFAMGYFLSAIAHKRAHNLAMERALEREKFDNLYHPIFIMLISLGKDVKEGISMPSTRDTAAVNQIILLLKERIYLAPLNTQKNAWEFIHKIKFIQQEVNLETADEAVCNDLDVKFGMLIGVLLNEYKLTADKLGYCFAW